MSNFYDQLARLLSADLQGLGSVDCLPGQLPEVIIRAELGSSALYHLPDLGFQG